LVDQPVPSAGMVLTAEDLGQLLLPLRQGLTFRLIIVEVVIAARDVRKLRPVRENPRADILGHAECCEPCTDGVSKVMNHRVLDACFLPGSPKLMGHGVRMNGLAVLFRWKDELVAVGTINRCTKQPHGPRVERNEVGGLVLGPGVRDAPNRPV